MMYKNLPQLDELDRKILRQLLQDARTPFLEIARECNVSGATVHLRMQKLEKIGVIQGSRLIVDYRKLGLGLCAFVGLYLEKGNHFDAILAQLKLLPEVVECHYATGNYAIFLKIYCLNPEHLRDLLIDKIQKIEHISRTETFISLEQSINRVPDLDMMLHDSETEE